MKIFVWVVVLAGIAVGWMSFEAWRVREGARREHGLLRVGMNVKEIGWPEGGLVFAACQLNGSKELLQKEDWAAVLAGSKVLPADCRTTGFYISGKVPEHVFYTIDFDGKWNVSAVGPLVFHED